MLSCSDNITVTGAPVTGGATASAAGDINKNLTEYSET